MTSREMHYDFKQKLNKIDSQKYRDLLVPEIDWKLNEAQEVFVKIVAQPRLGKRLGFEVNQRTIDDIRTIVVNQTLTNALTLSSFDNSSFKGTLPTDYWFFLKGKVIATKGTCQDKELRTRIVQHDDETEVSPFDRSSFVWRMANLRFFNEGIRVFTNKAEFIPSKLVMDYLKEPRMIHNAQDYDGGTYDTLTGQTLTGAQDCELPKVVHRDIVDLAVFITANDLNLANYGFKRDKLSFTETKS